MVYRRYTLGTLYPFAVLSSIYVSVQVGFNPNFSILIYLEK
jgi:hypothetical protein